MRCNNCGKEIDEFEIFCEDCKKKLKKSSSKKDLNELEDLIENQNKLNELEKTKEIPNLTELNNNLEDSFNEDKTENVEIEDIEDKVTRVERFEEKQKLEEEFRIDDKNKKKTILIICLIALSILSVGIVIYLIFTGKDNTGNNDRRDILNYANILKDYGVSIENTVKEYMDKNNNEIPTWKDVNDLNGYKKYEIICDIHNIYNDGSIYLSNCKVNEKDIEYSYGIQKEETNPGRKLEIYMYNYDGGYYYLSQKEGESKLVGSITCKTQDCEYISAYDKYIIVKEDSKYYLYNYENNSIEMGPFNIDNIYDYTMNLLAYNNTLYAIYYNDNGVNNLYNVNTSKTFTNMKGQLSEVTMKYDPNIMCKYGYAVFVENKENKFVNLKTGNVSYVISENIDSFIEDQKNKIVYITTYNNDYNKFKIYNSNGKLLFGGSEYSNFYIGDNKLLVSTDTEFKVYDSKLNLKLSSKKYDKILGLYDDFIVVIDNNRLEILNLEDKILATFDIEWDKDRYYFHNMLSGWDTYNDKNGIYLVVEDNTIPYGNLGSGLKYYYIPSTNEIGVIKTNGV